MARSPWIAFNREGFPGASKREICERPGGNVGWQSFSGMVYSTAFPCEAPLNGHSSAVCRVRPVSSNCPIRPSKAGVDGGGQAARVRTLCHIRVQEKAIGHPVDSRFLEFKLHKVASAAKRTGIAMKQTFANEGKALRRQGRRLCPRQAIPPPASHGQPQAVAIPGNRMKSRSNCMADIINDQPVFLVASVRSGSTLLGLMLGSHPRIKNPGEFDFLFDKIADDGALPDVAHYREWLRLDRIFLSHRLDIDTSMNFVNLIDSFVGQHKDEDSLTLMNVHRNFHRIPTMFPDARYIHLIRDGRDVARSCIGMNWVGNVYYGIDIWREAETSWGRLKETLHPSRYLEIKYEHLLDDIECGLSRICEFLGLTYSKSMLDYASTTTYSLPNNNLCLQWKTKYSKRELSLVEGKAGTILLKLGYGLSGEPTRKPSSRELTILYIQNKSFRVIQQISLYGFPLFLKYYLARKLSIVRWEKSLKTRINAIQSRTLK